VCPPGPIPPHLRAWDFAVYAGVLPEDKFKLVQSLQQGGHVVGMCGDGANDAPALRQAQMGIAVATVTDVAKAATGHALLTPLLMVLIMITGDFLGMSLTTDRVRPAPQPNAWHIGRLTLAGVIMGLGSLLFCGAVLAYARHARGLDLRHLQTLTFVSIVFVKQATTYTNRERRRLWSSRPSGWLVASSVADIAIAATLAMAGVTMPALPATLVVSVLGAAAVFAFALDAIKVPMFRHLEIR
jgi:H+-transporting ATPase